MEKRFLLLLALILTVTATPVLAIVYPTTMQTSYSNGYNAQYGYYPSTYMPYGERYAPYVDMSSASYGNVPYVNTYGTYRFPYGANINYRSTGMYGTTSSAQCLYKNAQGECMIEQYIDPSNYRPLYSAAPSYTTPIYDRDYLEYERWYANRYNRYDSYNDDDYYDDYDCDDNYRSRRYDDRTSSRYRRSDCRNIWDYFDE